MTVKVQELFDVNFNHVVCLVKDSVSHTGLLNAIKHLGDDVVLDDCQLLVGFQSGLGHVLQPLFYVVNGWF